MRKLLSTSKSTGLSFAVITVLGSMFATGGGKNLSVASQKAQNELLAHGLLQLYFCWEFAVIFDLQSMSSVILFIIT